MKKKLLLFVMMLLPMIASADSVEIDGIYYNLISKAKQAEVTSNPDKYSGNIVIPESVTYEGVEYEVTSIGKQAFHSCPNLVSLVIPESIVTIEESACSYCEKLESVIIPNSVTSIGPWAFKNCMNLSILNIPNSVVEIGYAAFSDCTSLISVIIPNSLTVIRDHLFCYCSNLSSITISDNVNVIERSAFEGCSSLNSVIVPNNVTVIESRVFYNCINLKSVSIGSGINSIGTAAFSSCLDLSDVFCYADNIPNIASDAFEGSYIEYATLHVLASHIDDYKVAAVWKDFGEIKPMSSDGKDVYKLNYYIDEELYKSSYIEEGALIIAETEPEKEGYTFSGWSEIPETMPAHDVTVTGTFSINSYKLTYLVDGEEYKTYELKFGAAITPEAEPTKEGHTFSGWSEIPAKMPAHDVTVTGTFSINKYKLTYVVDGVEYKSNDIEYGATITPEAEPTKEGYTFSGWSEIPETMPAHDVTVTGTFSINKYKLTYTVDGEVYKTYDIEYGAPITPEVEPTKEGYTFSGWSEIPATMPAHDVTVTGTFTLDTGIEEIMSNANGDVMIFTIDGKRVDNLKKGINVIRMKDGTRRKVVVR